MKFGLSICVDIVTGSANERHCKDSSEDLSAWPVDRGGNFVDLTLRVVVKQVTRTLMAFQPKFPHGTTCLCEAQNRMCTITFSQHIYEAYKIAAQEAKIMAGAGVGEGP
jgi:hypothetical protein